MLILVFHLLVKKECLLDSLDPVLPSVDFCDVSFCEISEAQIWLWKCVRLALIPLFASKRQLIVGYFPRLAQVHSGAPEILHVSFDPGWHSVPRSQ